MSNAFDMLSDDEVRQITCLVESLDRSTFDFLQLELGDMKLTIGKGSAPPAGLAAPLPAAAAVPAPAPAAVAPAVTAAPAAAAPAAKQESPGEAGTIAITAPIMGRFYARPEPGAAPFVTLGATVDGDATVGLIEVMKVFNAVRAGVSGVISEICVEDAQFIEFGQVLFRVRPAEAAAAPAGKKGSRK